MYSYLPIQHCALQPELQQPQCWSLTHVFLVVYGLRWYLLLELIRIFKQGTVAQYCFWLAYCINVTLFDCCRLTSWMLVLQEIEEFETGLSGVDHNIRHHPFSSSMVKRREFDDQRELFYKRNLHFGIKNLEQYSRMNTYSKWLHAKRFCRFESNRVAQKFNCPNCPWSISWVYIDLQLTLYATVLSPRRLHIASTAFLFCRYRSLFAGTFSLIYKYRSRHVNKQFTVPFSLHRTF